MRKHLFYYLTLIALLLGGFSAAYFLSSQKNLQMAMLVLTTFFYVLWGIVHHAIHHSFSLKIMLEYIAIATLGISIVFFVLQIAL